MSAESPRNQEAEWDFLDSEAICNLVQDHMIPALEFWPEGENYDDEPGESFISDLYVMPDGRPMSVLLQLCRGSDYAHNTSLINPKGLGFIRLEVAMPTSDLALAMGMVQLAEAADETGEIKELPSGDLEAWKLRVFELAVVQDEVMLSEQTHFQLRESNGYQVLWEDRPHTLPNDSDYMSWKSWVNARGGDVLTREDEDMVAAAMASVSRDIREGTVNRL